MQQTEMCIERQLRAYCILGSDSDPLTLNNNKLSLYSALLKTELTKCFTKLRVKKKQD